MGQPRILRPHTVSHYHAFSRIVDKTLRLGEAEKRYFRLWMRRLEKFCGVQVVTYCLMGNHFHLLVRVPQKDLMPELTEATLRGLLGVIYTGRQLKDAHQELDRACQASAGGNPQWLRDLLTRYHSRRYDLSTFVGELKQRFTLWYNGRQRRVGTLWEDKFHSVLVEGERNILFTMAAYIDLNPIRAGLAGDPKDYRWSGYGEAVAGGKEARIGLGAILDNSGLTAGIEGSGSDGFRSKWADTSTQYRLLLYGSGRARNADAMTGTTARKGFSGEEIEAELARGGQLSVPEILRCRVRYFCAGGVLGSEEYVDRVFDESLRGDRSKRCRGARKMTGADWGGMRVLRNLQRRVFG